MRLTLLLACSIALPAIGFAGPRATVAQANVMVELKFIAQRPHADPFNQVTLDVVFVDPSGRELRVPAFWDGSNVWKARYASPLTGRHRYRTECSDPADPGLHGVVGQVKVRPYIGKNPLYIHGPIQVAADHRHLEYHDGTPFFWLGDTWWMGLCHRLHFPDEFQQLTADRKEKGFNVVQIVAGLYPDMFPFDPRGANEAGFPWETNYTSIRPEYFDAADQRLFYLVDQGFTPCLVGAWGYFMPWMGVEKMKAHWRYLIARYGALPVVWCAAGEANLNWYLAKGFPYDDRNQVHEWTKVLRSIRETDPWHRPLTIHPTGIGPLTARHSTDDQTLLDFDMLQTPHGRQEAVPITLSTVRHSYAASPTLPVIDGEASYEMLNNNIPAEWTRRMFWLCLMNGAAGHTYGANGIWQCNRPGQPHGKSPHGGSYGDIPWNEAMHLPGSAQEGFGKRFFEQFDWPAFRPHPEWVRSSGASLGGASWIWFPEGNPALNAPAEKRYFRRALVIPPGREMTLGRLRVSADDRFTLWINGRKIGGGADWQAPEEFDRLEKVLTTGTNILAVEAQNMPASGANPAGLIASLEIQFAAGPSTQILSDGMWRSAKAGGSNWLAADFDDSAWAPARASAHYGDQPWGSIGQSDDGALGPLATGIAGQVRVIYAQLPEPVEVRELGARVSYRARYFNPVTGATQPLGEVTSDNNGLWTCAPPDGIGPDWVVVLDPLTKQPANRSKGRQASPASDF